MDDFHGACHQGRCETEGRDAGVKIVDMLHRGYVASRTSSYEQHVILLSSLSSTSQRAETAGATGHKSCVTLASKCSVQLDKSLRALTCSPARLPISSASRITRLATHVRPYVNGAIHSHEATTVASTVSVAIHATLFIFALTAGRRRVRGPGAEMG